MPLNAKCNRLASARCASLPWCPGASTPSFAAPCKNRQHPRQIYSHKQCAPRQMHSHNESRLRQIRFHKEAGLRHTRCSSVQYPFVQTARGFILGCWPHMIHVQSIQTLCKHRLKSLARCKACSAFNCRDHCSLESTTQLDEHRISDAI
jgi:hypothetical protein